MFESIRRRWAEARADVVSKEVEDMLRRFDLMNVLDQQMVSSAFENITFEVPTALTDEQKVQVAKGILKASEKAWATRGDNLMAHTSRVSAFGGTLAAHYLELQTIPGDRAANVIASIEDWRKQQQESDETPEYPLRS